MIRFAQSKQQTHAKKTDLTDMLCSGLICAVHRHRSKTGHNRYALRKARSKNLPKNGRVKFLDIKFPKSTMCPPDRHINVGHPTLGSGAKANAQLFITVYLDQFVAGKTKLPAFRPKFDCRHKRLGFGRLSCQVNLILKSTGRYLPTNLEILGRFDARFDGFEDVTNKM